MDDAEQSLLTKIANGIVLLMIGKLDLITRETRAINRRLDRLERGQFFELNLERKIMATLQDVQDAVTQLILSDLVDHAGDLR